MIADKKFTILCINAMTCFDYVIITFIIIVKVCCDYDIFIIIVKVTAIP